MTCSYKAGKRDILYRHRIAFLTHKLHGIPPKEGQRKFTECSYVDIQERFR